MSNQKIDLSQLNIEQLHVVKQQFDQELQHFQQSLQALIVAKSKFVECINDIKTISQDSNDEQDILIPASPSLYLPGKITNKNNKKFMVDVGTGYYVEKSDVEAIEFYEKKINKLNKESIQIQDIIKEKSQASMAIATQIRQVAMKQALASKEATGAATPA